MHILFCLLYMFFFYGVCAWALCVDGGIKKISNLLGNFNIKRVLLVLVIIVCSVLFVAIWIKQDSYVYYWDLGGYWSKSINRMNEMFNYSFKETFQSLMLSINEDDYNIFLPTIISLPLQIVGYTFRKYVVVCAIFFLVPVIILSGLVSVKIFESINKVSPFYAFLIGILVAALMPTNYYTMLRGYIDIACYIPILSLIWLFWDYDFKRIQITRNIAIALMMVVSWICRRYIVYFIIGYVVALLTKAICILVKNGFFYLKSIILDFVMIGGISIGLLLILFKDFILNALLTDYGDMYSAYNWELKSKIDALITSFGGAAFFTLLIAILLCFINRQYRVNIISIIILGLSETIIFWQTQIMDTHHRMMLNPMFFVGTVIIIYNVIYIWKNEAIKDKCFKLLGSIGALLFVLNFCFAYIPVLPDNLCGKTFAIRYIPLTRNDLYDLQVIKSVLNELTIGTEDSIYVTASGSILNSDILRKIDMPNSGNAIPMMQGTCDVDLRDGFPSGFLTAKYIVATDPVQLHLPDGQEVVSYLNDNVMNQESYLGQHFEKIYSREIEDGVNVIIYRKNSEFSEEDLLKLKDYYDNLYPDHYDMFGERILEN
ncbi:MAG: hypothetical protein E7274_02615 [Pseudobutyrivibrio ruminis]|uniref:hypothetical protein n=1 Tax=Pseudobutyrivibrio ruminis TaxID=46206 RepID=UPI0026EB6922|nr:hypothetical protein [Pseudobutyrivibrio ruminis]MBE5912936.1 hypothetical protein [Pseudobutyrivibrio ruminis]